MKLLSLKIMNNKILRQLKDIQVQAENLLSNEEINPEQLESFYIFSEEINSLILKTSKNELIVKIVNEIKNTEFEKVIKNTKTVELFGFDFFRLFRKHSDLLIIKDLIRFLQSKYASLELLFRNG